jgi:Mg-chelatase subunit ChlD
MSGKTRTSLLSGNLENGMITAFGAASLLTIFCIAALVTDVGFILVKRTELSKAVDAGALAGAQDLPSQTSARTAATNYVALNVRPGPPDTNVTFPANNTIRVAANYRAPSFFAKVIGVMSFDVPAVAEAKRFDPNLALIIDRSGSMCEVSHPKAGANCPTAGPWEPFNTIQAIAKGFVDEMEGDPQFTLISYSTTARLDVALTDNRASIKKAIDDLKPGGYTDIASSVNEAIEELLKATGPEPKLVILLTDGRTNTVNGRYVGDGNSQAVNALLNASSPRRTRAS